MRLLLATIASLAAKAFSMTLTKPRRINVTLSPVESSVVKITVLNTFERGFNLLKEPYLLGNSPVQRFSVWTQSGPVRFTGVILTHNNSNVTSNDFQLLPRGESVSVEIDLANTHDLPKQAEYHVQAEGYLPYAEEDSVKMTASFHYRTDTLKLGLADTEASNSTLSPQLPAEGKQSPILQARKERHARNNILDRRMTVQERGTCPKEKLDVVTKAIENCYRLAVMASTAARTGSGLRMKKFFVRDDQSTRDSIAENFNRIANDCSTDRGPISKIWCYDHDRMDDEDISKRMGSTVKICASPVTQAYVVPGTDRISLCPDFYNMPALSTVCAQHDQAGVILHEVTHSKGVLQRVALDHRYGVVDVQTLPPHLAATNADSYRLFANSVWNNCPVS